MSSRKSPTKNGKKKSPNKSNKSHQNKQSNKSKSKSKNSQSQSQSKPKSKSSQNQKKSTKQKSQPNNSNSFVYGFKVHSLSTVNAGNKHSQKKNKKSPNKNRNKQPQSSPFSTASSSVLSIELYTSSVAQLLDCDHLNAPSAISLHDLQCGTATIALQAFLSFPNLRRVFGIEQNKELFHWATQNLMALIRNGYQSNKYLLVEQIPSNKMTIAQKSSPSELAKKVFKVGQVVYCYIPLKQNNIKKRDNYQGIIRAVSDDGIHFDVEMSATKTVVKKVHKESVFKPGTERTFEICRGNLFERSDSFRSDIVLLPYSISNDSFRSLLLTGCKRSPIHCRILSFSHLESWDGFPAQQLRRIDANVYDNDRYDSNLSPYHKLYIYSHVLSPHLASAPKEVMQKLNIDADITVRDSKNKGDTQLAHWYPARVLGKNEKQKSITVHKHRFIGNTGIEEIAIDEQRIHIINRVFKTGDLVCCYCPKYIETNHENMYRLFKGQITVINDDGTYGVTFEDGETHPKVAQTYIFNRNKALKYSEGQVLYGYRYDNIDDFDEDGEMLNIKTKKSVKKMEKGLCIVRHINADGTYRIEFIDLTHGYLHDSFCETWLKPLSAGNDSAEEKKMSADMDLPSASALKLPLIYEIDYDRVLQWKPCIVSHWLSKCGVSGKACGILKENNVNGVCLFELDRELLCEDLGMGSSDAKRVMRYMRTLKRKLGVGGDEEELKQVRVEIGECAEGIRMIKKESDLLKQRLDKLSKSNGDEYNKYKEWELKLQCLALNNSKKMTKKEIAQQLKKNMNWVKKICKLKPNQIRKPSGNVIKQFESLQTQILKLNKEIKGKQMQMLSARQRMQQYKGE